MIDHIDHSTMVNFAKHLDELRKHHHLHPDEQEMLEVLEKLERGLGNLHDVARRMLN